MTETFYQTKLFRALFIIIFFAFIVFIAFWLLKAVNEFKRSRYIGQEFQRINTIVVSGTGEIYAKPDLGLITLSVVSEAATVQQAITENTLKMNKVIGFIKEKGIEEKDLKTTNFSINPRYEYQPTTNKRTLVGYEARQSLEVKIRDLSKTGSILEGATKFGANEVGDLRFVIDNEEELRAQAREEAIKKAKTKAEILAKQLGVKLVRITGFAENSDIPFYPYYQKIFNKETMSVEAPQIETGENKISITVSITYEIN